MKKPTMYLNLLTLSFLLVVPMVSAGVVETFTDGILNKFDNFMDCYFNSDIEKRCHQFDYNKDGVVACPDAGKFMQKYTKMVRQNSQKN